LLPKHADGDEPVALAAHRAQYVAVRVEQTHLRHRDVRKVPLSAGLAQQVPGAEHGHRVVVLRVFVFAVEVGQDGDFHGHSARSIPHRARVTGRPPYFSSSV